MKNFIKFLRSNSSSTNCLESLANSNHTYWKFTQSKPECSIEKNIYTEYIENQITVASDSDKGLSFTTEENIAKCFMYGDQLTKLCFSKKNPLFKKIKKNTYKYLGGGLCEYETTMLIAEKHYSLKYKSTIRLLVELLPDNQNISLTAWFRPIDSFEERLTILEFYDSARLLHIIQQNYNKNMWLKKEDVLRIIDDYTEF